MKATDKGLNSQVAAIEDTQAEIRIAVKNGYLSRKPKWAINAQLRKIINNGLKEVTNADLRDAAVRSLNAFAERQFNTLRQNFGVSSAYVLALAAVMNNAPESRAFEMAARRLEQNPPPSFYQTEARGIALQKYSRNYFRDNVSPVLDRLASENALDPDDVSGRNSLRNRAEMEVRYARHLDDIKSLRAAGIKLVTSSVHADCSDRCYKWQGRVYSLDGTSGRTEDGKPFIPLEEATDVYYTTKAGKTYKNGLFGFNCRHFLTEYKAGMVIPHVGRKTQKRENAINTRQRELEREVREARTEALTYKDIDRERYLAARRRAIVANKAYMQFSHDNGRAYYPSRVQLF